MIFIVPYSFIFSKNIWVGGKNIDLVHSINIITENKNAYRNKFLTLTKELWLALISLHIYQGLFMVPITYSAYAVHMFPVSEH